MADFTDRENEAEHLASNFRSLINTILISPRRWGKTSLVNQVSEMLVVQEPELKICHIDLFHVRTEEEFYIELATEILKSTSAKWEELAQNTKEFLSRLLPNISFSLYDQSELTFGISWNELKKNPNDILDLAETIAVARKFKIVICIDEFQSIGDFKNPLSFQKKLRSHWQRHTHVAYCLYGSKRHMLMDVFTNPSMPFYKFGDLMFLENIKTEDWVKFITRRFSETGKEINEIDATKIADLAENHSYYVQQIAQQTWLRTDNVCTGELVDTAHQGIINQLGLLFTNITESLSNKQMALLKAIISGEKQLSSQSTILNYNLGTSANVLRLKQSLLAREIIDITADQIDLQDPMYKYWLRVVYFKLKSLAT